ncbi:MAG: response regulator [Ruminococcus albus]|nr:response regulator [Ruminococcus albus]MBO5558088.1 response regulator [Ruminococcus sp.]
MVYLQALAAVCYWCRHIQDDSWGELLLSKVLIIDDDAMAVRMAGFILKKKGHTAVGAENGSDGRAKLLSEKPALTLLDIEMPDENGMDVLKAIRADALTADAKVCLMTGTVDDKVLSAAAELGALGCLEKPVQAQALEDVLKKAGI